ncbi:hypothetical protein EOL70_13100 [Leucothrix sargassi]|nr:hypothetical protein EOL70_13100 [Leucothrix sargassi]
MPLPTQQPVYLIDGSRTPFNQQLRRNAQGETTYSPQDLIHTTARSLLSRHAIQAEQIDDVVVASSKLLGCADLALHASQRLRCHQVLSPQTLLGSEHVGLQALSYAFQSIAQQEKSLILLGAVETTPPPVISMSDELSQWLHAWKNANGISAKTKVFNTLHTRFFSQKDNSIDHSEALFKQRQQQAEQVASESFISLAAQAEYVNLSQRRLKYAQRNNNLCHITPIYYPDGHSVSSDENLITLDPESLQQAVQTSPEASGVITQSSVAQMTEGACCLLLASQDFIDEHNIVSLAQLNQPTWGADIQAVKQALETKQLSVADIDYWEWDESSAAEILALKQHPYFKTLNSFDRINLDGGSLALGSPNAANQLRNILQLANNLKRNDAQQGLSFFNFAQQNNSATLVQRSRGSEA